MRFRVLFWVVVVLAVLPEVVSGFVLLPTHGVDGLCAVEHAMLPVGAFKHMVAWERVHAVGRWASLVAGALVLAYAASWAALSGLGRARKRLLWIALGAGLLPSLALALATGRALPWQALRPGVTLGETARTVERAPEEGGGPDYCLVHAREVNNLRIGWLAHVIAGVMAAGFTIGLADFAARWRRAREGSGRKG